MSSASLPELDSLDREALLALLLEERYEIEHLKLVIEKLRHRLFGSKSEKLDALVDQLELDLEERETAGALAVPEIAASATDSSSRQRPHRKPLPENLPREVITYTPFDNCCPGCGEALEQFGEDVSEQLERIPATFKVIRHVRPKFACARCERVFEAPAPPRPIERGLAGPALLAHVLVSKYGDHQPLYRQSEMYAREGVDLDRSTLAGWVGASSVLLSPLVTALRDHVLTAEKVHADDTPVPVLAPGLGKTKTGRLWT
jgi:transposase